jgi:translation initiation factor 1
VTRPDPVRLVYSTGAGRVCATCGWPERECRCSSRAEEKIPSKVVVKLRVETKGRGGKSVTVVDGLPRNVKFVEELARDLKKSFGTGGTAGDGFVELQGDRRETLRRLLSDRGFAVKG